VEMRHGAYLGQLPAMQDGGIDGPPQDMFLRQLTVIPTNPGRPSPAGNNSGAGICAAVAPDRRRREPAMDLLLELGEGDSIEILAVKR
jgi:hypothetical protein